MQKLLEAAAKVAALDPEARAELVRFLRAEARENRASAPVWPDRPSESDQAFEHMAIAELAIADLVEAAVASVAEVTLSGPGARAALPRLLAHDPDLVAVLVEEATLAERAQYDRSIQIGCGDCGAPLASVDDRCPRCD